MGKHGPILSSSDDTILEDHHSKLKIGEGVYGGEPGFPEESKGKIPTLIYEKTGKFGDPDKA